MKAKLSLGCLICLQFATGLCATFPFPHVFLMHNVWLNLAYLILRKAEGIMGSHIAFSSHTVGS